MTQIDEKQNEKTMTVEIYGQNYPIKGKVDPKFMEQVAEYVDESMKEIGANMSSSFAIHNPRKLVSDKLRYSFEIT